MGMDVYSGDDKHYFRANVWSWPVIVYLTEWICPQVQQMWTGTVLTNDGEGLDEEDARTVAAKLQQSVADGSLRAAWEAFMAEINSLPNVKCKLCDGTGVRNDHVGRELGMPARNWCNGCDGKGEHKHDMALYGVQWEHLLEWVEFVDKTGHSGGFKVY